MGLKAKVGGSDRCVVCDDSDLSAPVPINGEWALRVCRTCGTAMTWPPPTDEEMRAINTAQYPLESTVATYTTRAGEFRGRWDQLLDYVGRRPQSVLDVGCSVGFFLDHMRTRGLRRVAGVEVNPVTRGWAVEQLHLDVRPSMEDFNGERFDLVTFQDCLEHLRNPVDALRRAAALVEHGGLIFVQLPNRSSEMARRAGAAWPWYSAPDHLVHLTPSALAALANLAGCSVVSMRTADAVADYLQVRFPSLPSRPVYGLRRLPGFHRLRVRQGDAGGLIQAVVEPPARAT